MNATARAVDGFNRGDTTARRAIQEPKPTLTRPVQRVTSSSQAIHELTETLKRIMASATSLLSVPNCWIAGMDGPHQKLITVASLSQETPEAQRIRSSQYYAIAQWVTSQRLPALINNTLKDPRCKVPGRPLGGSILCVPLLSGQQVFGTITVSSSSPDAFQQQSLMILQVLADQTILAISKARQIEASQQQAQELATFLDVARAITATLTTAQMLQAVIAGIRRLVSCDEAVIFGFVEEKQELRALTRLATDTTQLGSMRVSLYDKQSQVAWVAQNRRPLLQELGGRVFAGRVTQELLGQDDMALLGVPLLSQEHLRGVIMLGRFTDFDPSDLRIVQNLSNIIALAMEHVDVQKLTSAS